MAEEGKTKSFTTPILIILLVIASFLLGTFWTRLRSLEQEGTGAGGKQTAQASPAPAEEAAPLPTTIGAFSVTEEDICTENGRPLVYMFGSSNCPHCTWEHPIFEEVTAEFTNQISLHDNMDTQDDMEVFQRYSQINQGGIPFIVLGCRYVRVGSGEAMGEEEEANVLTALICKLTDNEPGGACSGVEDLIEQIE
jgi:thiol-disulfide isomerase/thioredoxin